MKLMDIQETVQQIAEAMAAVLKVEVEIADEHLMRVAGTGKTQINVLRTMAGEDYVYQRTLRTGEAMIIKNPGFEPICSPCAHFGNCPETGEISCPIQVDGEAVGVIGLLSFDREQRTRLFENEEHILSFLDKMADLIAAKLKEHKTYQELQVTARQLTTVMNYLDQGVIALDGAGEVIHMNQRACEQLQIEPQGDERMDDDRRFLLAHLRTETKQGRGPREVRLGIGGEWRRFIVSAHPIRIDGREQGAILTLDDPKKVETLIRRFADKEGSDPFQEIIGNSPLMIQTKEKARKVAGSDSTVLILGESGTGKELFARAIHLSSKRAGGMFVSINCGAIPDNLLESELFGYEEGAFTGARKGGKMGKFELADGGTVFLDEIGDMPPYLQVKLLRVLQEKQVERIGSEQGGKEIDVRVIAATNRNLEEMVRAGHFRKDLYYRLNVIPLELPPLSTRREDILTIANHYLNRYVQALQKPIRGFSLEVQNRLLHYSWPGNIRELANAIEYAVNMETSPLITLAHLPMALQELPAPDAPFETGRAEQEELNLRRLEKQAIIQALKQVADQQESKEKAALLLGISRATLFRKIKEYGL